MFASEIRKRRVRHGAVTEDIKTLQKFASVHASICNHFNLERHLNRRDVFKQTAPLPWPNGSQRI